MPDATRRVAGIPPGGDESAAGIACVTRGAYPDPKLGDPRRVVVALAPVRALTTPVPLALTRTDAALKTMELARDTRLSVMPITDAHAARLERLGG